MQSFLIIIHIIGLLFISGLGFLILTKKRNKLNIIFFLICLCIAIWFLGTIGILLNIGNDSKIIFWDKFVYIGATFIIFFVYHLSLVFTKKKQPIKLYFGYFIFSIFLILSRTKYFAKEIYQYSWGGHLKAELLHHAFLMFAILYLYFLLYNFLKYYKSTKSSLEKNQAKYIFYSFAFLAICCFSFLPAYGIGISPIINLFAVAFMLIMAYAITRYRLMGITIIFRKTSIYFFTIISYLLILLLVIYATAIMGGITVNWTIVWMAFCVGAILLTLFDNIKNFFTQLANKYFFSDIVDYQQTITNLAKKLPNEIKLDKVVSLIIGTLINTIKLNSAGILLFNSKTSKYEIIKTIGFNKKNGISLITNTFLINYLKNRKQLVAAQELEFLKEAAKTKKGKTEFKNLKKDMNRIEAGLCLPLFSAENLIGVIVLGNKISNDAYSKEDLEMLEIVANQASIAIDNARLYKEVQDFNKNLQKKVDEQTKDIKNKTERLRKLLTMRSEFLNITSHQLRTPVSVIKGILSMIKEGSIPKERQKEFLDSAFQRTIKLNEIINDILDASAIDSGKFEIQFSPISVEPILKEIYQDKKQDNLDLDKKIKFVLNLPEKQLPKVLSNEKYLRHILLNLINNAFQYTIKGSIIIKAETEKDKIIIKIIDTGIGIGKDDVPKLFQKFGRAKNAISTYTDGSGLGLFIIKKIIDEHKGAKVYIEKTEINKGSIFVLELPSINSKHRK